MHQAEVAQGPRFGPFDKLRAGSAAFPAAPAKNRRTGERVLRYFSGCVAGRNCFRPGGTAPENRAAFAAGARMRMHDPCWFHLPKKRTHLTHRHPEARGSCSGRRICMGFEGPRQMQILRPDEVHRDSG